MFRTTDRSSQNSSVTSSPEHTSIVPRLKLYTYKTAAEVLDCSASKVQKMCLAGEIPIIKVGNETRIDERDLDRWIQSRRYFHEPKDCGRTTPSEPNPTTEAVNGKG